MPDSRQRDGSGDSPARGVAAPDPLIGRVINERFKIVSVIARGGMGKVYRAEQAPLGRICALKVLAPKYDGDRDPEFHRRFVLEASTAAKMTHPNTVTVFDYGQSDEIYYIAMEYIEGKTLHLVLREDGPFTEQRTCHIARQICRSLREAHSLGVVHRDLKPGNVLLVNHEDEQDHVKVLDFGLVKDVESGQDLTQQGLFMGSPKYMAPEQITGGQVSAGTDIYALGILMFEMLTGRVPYDKGASVSTLMSHVHDPLPRLAEMNPDVMVTPAMEAIIYRCLDKDPARRFSSMNDLLAALKRTGGEAGFADTHESLPAMVRPYTRSSRPSFGMSGEYGPSPGHHARPSSVPPTSAIAYSGSLSADTGSLRAPGAPVFVSPPITDSLGPRPRPPPAPFPAPAQGTARRIVPWVAAGALTAAVGVGVVISTRSGANDAGQLSPQAAATQVPATPTAAPTGAATATGAAEGAGSGATTSLTIHVESNPPGATVLEGNKELCSATPCKITWYGDEAGQTVKHELTFEKKGFKPTKVNVMGAEGADRGVRAKLDPAPVVRTGGGSKLDGYKDNPFD